MFGRKNKGLQYGCIRCSAIGVPDQGPTRWWFLPGCDHVGGSSQVCGPCKEQIDLGIRVPGVFACSCGASPVITPVEGDR